MTRAPAFFASMGVSMYLTREALTGLLTDLARREPGSTLVMSFMLLAEPALRPGIEAAARGARANGTPFVSCGFREVAHVSAATLGDRSFAARADGLRPPLNAEELLVAT